MALPKPHIITPDSALGGIQLERSLRFNSGDSTYLERTPSSAGNRKTNTLSFWVKLGKSGVSDSGTVASCNSSNTDASNISVVIRDSGVRIVGYYNNFRITNRILRDPTSWYHIVLVIDTTQASADNRIKIYVNGVQETSFSTSGSVSQNDNLGFAQASTTRVGSRSNDGNGSYFDGYLTEVNFIDGQAYDPSYFGFTDAQTGQWRPKKYGGTYGTTGFHLDFSDNSSTAALGIDKSGNSNNFTPNNFSVTAGEDNDYLLDTPTNNFATFNPLVRSNNTFSEGDLKVTCSSSTPASFYSTLGASSGKYYMEFLLKSVSNYVIGVSGSTVDSDYFSNGDQIGFWLQSDKTRVFRNGSNITGNSEVVGNFETGVEGSSTGWAVDDIAGLALDMDKKLIYLYKESTQVGYVDFSGFSYEKVFFGGGNYVNGLVYVGNFGQRPFAHTPPVGYRSLNSRNLATPLAAGVVRPQRHFGIVTWSGNDSSQTIDGLEFTPDFVWIKAIRSGENHVLTDVIRGAGIRLQSNTTAAESDRSSEFTAFVRGGFTIAGTHNEINGGGVNMVAWCWKAGGTAVTNTVGNISAQVSANDEAGFSIITYTGDGNSSGNVGTGLRSTQPLAMAIVKRRDDTSDWHVGHIASGQSSNFAYHTDLNDNGTLSGSAPYHMGTQSYTNGDRLYLATGGLTSSATYVAYVWQERPGYSKFGSYTGNGSTDGPFVFTGFRPAFILWKPTTQGATDWVLMDSTRDTFNPLDTYLLANSSGPGGTLVIMDFLSNGFKLRQVSGNNESGETIVFMAFAERPSGTMFGLDANSH